MNIEASNKKVWVGSWYPLTWIMIDVGVEKDICLFRFFYYNRKFLNWE